MSAFKELAVPPAMKTSPHLMFQRVQNAGALIRPEALRQLVQRTLEGWVVRDSLPELERASFERFLIGSCCPLGDGVQKYALAYDFERWLDQIEFDSKRTPKDLG